jgi:signal transduction histidine kinase
MLLQNVSNTLLIVSSILGLFFTFIIWFSNSKSWTNRYLAIIIALADIWGLSIFFTLKTGNVYIGMISFFVTAWIIIIGNLLILHRQNTLTSKNIWIFIAPGILISLITILPNLIVKNIDVSSGFIRVVQYGPLYQAFSIFILIYLGIFIINAWLTIRKSEGQRRLQNLYIVIGFLLSAFLGSVCNLVLPALHIYNFNSLGPIFMLFVSIGASYAATKHYIYGYEVVLSEAWTFLLIMLSLVWLFLNLSVFNTILFVLLVSICFLFIRSTLSEADKKNQLQKDKESLQKLDKLKDEFLQMAEHELNTPIGVIEGRLSMILDENIGGFTPEQKKYLAPIFKDAKRLAKLSSDLVFVSEIDEGKNKIFPQPTQIIDLISLVTSKFRKEAELKGLKLEIVAPEHLPSIKIDRDKIKKVLSNLTENAIKFTKSGLIRISANTEGKNIIISISDTGIGIKKEDLDRIFGKFYQADRFSEIPLEQQGTGLNLYIAKNLIELHDGKIWVDSTPGHGSTFSFKLPIS